MNRCHHLLVPVVVIPLFPNEILLQFYFMRSIHIYHLYTFDSIGMIKAFTDGADFGRMADAQLTVSDIVHKAFISVHETGTEAAAATAVGVSTTSLDPSIPKVSHLMA